MQNVRILDEFKQLYDVYKKKFENQRSFKSMKRNQKHKETGDPVFYVGVPGLAIAITMTVIMILTVYLLSLPFMWYVWVPFVILVFFSFRIAMKYDKVRQIRYMLWSVFDMSMTLMQKAEEAEKDEDKHQHYTKAKDLLSRASEWVDEPALIAQITELEKILPK